MACDAQALLTAGASFQAFTEKELDIAIVELLRQWAGSSATPEELLAAGACMDCLETRDLEIVKASLLCSINNG